MVCLLLFDVCVVCAVVVFGFSAVVCCLFMFYDFALRVVLCLFVCGFVLLLFCWHRAGLLFADCCCMCCLYIYRYKVVSFVVVV